MSLPTFSDDRPSGRPLGAIRGRPSLRRLWPSDGPAVHAFFLRLDPETRASRFMAAVGDRAAAAYAAQAMVAPGLIVGVFVDGTLRAIGELRPFGPGQAEAALTVERGFRRAGLGLKLLRRLAEAARNRGLVELRLRCMPHNVAMRRLVAGLGAELRLTEGESEGAIRLAQPTPLSLWREGIEAALDFNLAVVTLPRSRSLPLPCLPPFLARAA
ncbi:GNAT family N-acetyltransferase [Methylorubrum extorquens]|uniref:GNAT family N-acetyltransferase n=1 Tax=Methylorubrum extorquens TaxID=408 RepID=UPI002238FD8C|nr:GNAT family N-acetyltransferase [Methylorubrum extorquens]UYW27097.1 GNAT family N-acetyltransferase [Methylorubrum extorquens]UYW33010.1 GNAT family N-acetyltransferase [Methylorubrum extorquens]